MGAFCQKDGLDQFGNLAALRVDSPFASISKVFFGLGIASDPDVNTEELMNQLKTSGSERNVSGKRNEWWERQAICDKSKTNEICLTLMRTGYFANMFGFSTFTDCASFAQLQTHARHCEQ